MRSAFPTCPYSCRPISRASGVASRGRGRAWGPQKTRSVAWPSATWPCLQGRMTDQDPGVPRSGRADGVARSASRCSSPSTPPSRRTRPPCEAAMRAGATLEDLLAVLVAVAGSVGRPRVVAAAPRIALAAGYDIDAALEKTDCRRAADPGGVALGCPGRWCRFPARTYDTTRGREASDDDRQQRGTTRRAGPPARLTTARPGFQPSFPLVGGQVPPARAARRRPSPGSG